MKAIIYARVSSENQKDNHSIDSQISLCTDYANKNGYYIDKIYYEICSGKNNLKKNCELYKLISENNNITLLVYDIDRLSRSITNGMDCYYKCKAKNIIIYSIVQKILYNTIDTERQFIDSLNQANYESNKIGLRIKNTCKNIRNKGGHIGPAKYGFKKSKVNKIPVLIKENYEQEIIKFISLLRIGDKSSTEINNQLKKIIDNPVPLHFYDKNDNIIEKFNKPYTLNFIEISNILNDYNIKYRNNKNFTRNNVNYIFNQNKQKIGFIQKIFNNLSLS